MSVRRSNPRGHGDRLRTDLLAATRRLADRLGSTERLSIRAIAKEVGVAPPSVYLHFRNLNELFRAAVAEDYQALASVLREAASAQASPIDRLVRVGRAYCSFAIQYPGRYRLITEVRQAGVRGRQSHAGHPAAEVQSILMEVILECQRAGMRPEIAPDLILTSVWSGWHGFVELRRNKPLREWPDPETVADLITRSLLGVPGDQLPGLKEARYRKTTA